MMIKLVLLLCTAVFGVLGAPGLTEAPTPCCTASQWEGVMLEVGGYAAQSHAGFLKGSIAVSYDMLGKRVATVSHLNYSAGAQSNMKVIQDFKGGMQYVIMNTTCTKSALKGAMPPNCMPDDAKFGGGFYFGSPSSQLPCQRWLYTYNGTTFDLTVTQQDCIPVIETEYSGTDAETECRGKNIGSVFEE
ncbi:mammalian ependymin-related protein 1-like [Lingula anatina]|uniref:Mammalian ependymin-related protein 1-like n=1 Tax=Lingula anatina TaxID=7574 RepID=A0A1S3JD49_LINAN|nr:mammalian ependymin-related protein 1-like [Lingula anatina]|eukprot:XP_013408332.1 mammalian ependymin-related protein 1-like [Lingula anatina]